MSAWPPEAPSPAFQEVDGTLAFVDVSGFTQMSERLARSGKVGAEEVAEVIGSCFSSLLGVAYAEDGSLIKFGGDALLLLFSGEDHPLRAARAASRMRRTLREIGRLETSAGGVALRMSVGVHSGPFHFYLVGDRHHELLVTGPAASRTVEMESAARTGEVLISPETAAGLPGGNVGARRGPGFLLRGTPPGAAGPAGERGAITLDLAHAIPQAIREHLLAGGSEAEHRLVAVAFVRFSGVDARAGREGPKSVCRRLHDLIRLTQGAADDHGIAFLGTDIDRDGGKIILTAGAPTSRGDDDGRMLAAVRAVVDGEPSLPVSIGVHRGHVFAGDIGPPYRRTYTVMGDAVNLAARLMGRAAPGEVVATADPLECARTRFEAEALDPFTVKGKTRPVMAFRVGPRAGAGEAPQPASTPLVGREAEMRALLGALRSARRGRGRVVEIVGEPGIGKSRLLAELVAHAGGLVTLASACEPYEAATPYRPFRGLLAAALGLGEHPGAEAVAGLEELAASRAPELHPWLPLLAVPLGVEIPPTREVEQLEERFRRPRLAATVEQLVAVALDGPVLMLFEDTHWMDEASGDLLAHLAAAAPRHPWMLCVTRREGDTGFAAPEGPATLSLRPPPLAAEEAASLLAATTEESPLRPHEIHALTERAGGNPLFLAELLAAARESGFGGLPDSVEGAITARIDTLPPRDRSLLRRVSVLGTSFDRPVAEAILGDEAEGVWARLAPFLEEEDGAIRFRHALIRDAAYEALPFRQRRDLHALAGETIERAAGADADEAAGVLSLHFFEARRFETAWSYARIAGDRAAAIYANSEAARLFERALAAARHLRDVPTRDLLAAWEALGDVHQRVGEFGAAVEAYRAGRRLLTDDRLTESRLLLKEALVAQRAGRLSEALRRISRARAGISSASGTAAARLRAELSVWYASVRQEQGRSGEAIRWCRQAIEEGELAGAEDVVAHASYLLDWAHVARGELDRAVHSDRAREIYERLGDLAGQANVLGNLGLFAYYRGEWRLAVEHYRRSQELQEKVGNAVEAMYGNLNIAVVLTDQGHLGEAERLAAEALRVWRAAGVRVGAGFALAELARIAARGGRHEEATSLLTQARDIFVEIHKPTEVLMVDVVAAECALLRGAPDSTRELAERALAGIASVDGAGVHAPLAHRVLGLARLAAGERTEARRSLEASIGEARERHADFEVALTLSALARLEREEGRRARAEALEAESGAILERLDVRTVPGIP